MNKHCFYSKLRKPGLEPSYNFLYGIQLKQDSKIPSNKDSTKSEPIPVEIASWRIPMPSAPL